MIRMMKFEMGKWNYVKTRCPYRKEDDIRVGSIECQHCIAFVKIDYKKMEVGCKKNEKSLL